MSTINNIAGEAQNNGRLSCAAARNPEAW